MTQSILLVEDDQAIARIVKDTLTKEGYFVTWSTTGLEGWEDFQNGDYDLALIDLMLPEMDGFTLCKNIRFKSDMPIIIISARKEDVDKVEGFTQGADDYLAKPFSLVELKARVASQLRRWQRYKGETLAQNEVRYDHGLTIHYDNESVMLDSTTLALTKTEWELLRLLATHAERAFSKEELYEHVWQQAATANDLHTVTVHIKGLREKLADPVKTPRFIQTVWGKGYRFIGETL
ncbi:response regulator transcription factor [Metalysinibacillus jejuensis]|uniref:response regulator transcription factor n=1 Tax=Metalysinibacillus jejuensis TaxID=914327 RepID=UPI000D3A5396|nr:response regulator transcription factor [Metalysinibacillus jejuensis]